MGEKKAKKEAKLAKKEAKLFEKLAKELEYTYTAGEFKYVEGEPPYVINGIKGKDNYPHVIYEFGIKYEYYGNGSARVITLSRLNLTVYYHKGGLFDSKYTDDKGSFDIDIISFIRRNVKRSNGEEIKNISSKLIEELNKVAGSNLFLGPFLFKPGILPPDGYLSLLKAISVCTDLKIESSEFAVLGIGTCIKVDDKGVILFNEEKYSLPMEQLFGARADDKGEMIYYRGNKYIGFIFKPFR